MKYIHPFPARMAPDLVINKIASLSKESFVLDPMCGSGTTLKHAINSGHKAVGWDIDPLAVKISRTWCRRFDINRLKEKSRQLEIKLNRQRVYPESRFKQCEETQAFVDYWFAELQRDELNRLSLAIEDLFPAGRTLDFFHIALSRTIITKFKGASLAWDISHSRPHRKKVTNDFETISEFFKSVEKLIQIFEANPNKHDASVFLKDCRTSNNDKEFDLIITSPPYLNAIDYMRGHKFSLIWMGYTIPQLKEIRTKSVGIERKLNELNNEDYYEEILNKSCSGNKITERVRNYVLRYIYDCEAMIVKMKSLLKKNGDIVLVIGNSNQYGTKILNDKIFLNIAADNGLSIKDKKRRIISRQSRYLPIKDKGQISNRMKSESILHFVRA